MIWGSMVLQHHPLSLSFLFHFIGSSGMCYWEENSVLCENNWIKQSARYQGKITWCLKAISPQIRKELIYWFYTWVFLYLSTNIVFSASMELVDEKSYHNNQQITSPLSNLLKQNLSFEANFLIPSQELNGWFCRMIIR